VCVTNVLLQRRLAFPNDIVSFACVIELDNVHEVHMTTDP
jgi:hypothetical protein